MKKLLMALATVACAAGLQAATFNWSTSTVAYGINAATVVDNGDYTAGTTAMRNNGTWSYVLSIYEAGTDTLVGSANGSISLGTTKKVNTSNITVAAAAAGTAYDYVITITGTQNDLTARGVEAAYDYTAATLETTISGSITTAGNGNTGLATAVPSTWTVSGIVAAPEPTSGVLMLLGLAGLALRRRRA